MFEQIPRYPADGDQYVFGDVTLVYNKQYNTWAPVGIDQPVNVLTNPDLEQFYSGAITTVVLPKGYALMLTKWEQVKADRDRRIVDVQWRYERYAELDRLGEPQVDSLAALDAYVQALKDVTNQPDPYNIIWPTL